MDSARTADIDDTPTFTVLDAEVRRRGAYELERSGVVQREDGIPLFIRHLMNHAIPSESRIIDNDMDLASAELGCFLDELVNVGGGEYVAGYGEGFSACVVDGLGDRVGFCAVDVLDDYVGAFAGEELGGFGADALARAGYDGDLIGEHAAGEVVEDLRGALGGHCVG